MELKLRYGCNPHQRYAAVECGDGMPLRVLNGSPGYINILDALTGWQLVRELKAATGLVGAASYKHVSPAGAAVGKPVSRELLRSQFLPEDEGLSPAACAYVRARAGDRMCSYGDAVAISDTVDVSLAQVLVREVSDLVIAPAYETAALEILKAKRKGQYLILQIDPAYEPPAVESRDVFGLTLKQSRNVLAITPGMLAKVVTKKKQIPEEVAQTLLVATIALKYTQSNSVCLAYDGQVIGMGAGQQSRVHCTRLACSKAEKWLLQQHPKVLGLRFREGTSRIDRTNVVDQYLLWDELSPREMEMMLSGLEQKPEPITRQERQEWFARFAGICLSSDAYIPFRDNIDRARQTNVQYVMQTGGSLRDEDVTAAADEYGMVMVHSGVRCFLH